MKEGWTSALEFFADNKFVLGERLVEVGVSAPELQAALAAVALAQGELGHARHLYHWVQQIQEVSFEVTGETGSSLPKVGQVENWIELMVAVLVVNAATKTFLDQVRQEDPQTAVQKTGKMMVELEEHLTFSGEWCRRFAGELGAIPRLYQQALADISGAMESWMQGHLADWTASPSVLLEQYREELSRRCNPPIKAAVI